ncbi:hypothetical protein V1477_000247 [Vespula maculifrons]|uniref:Uncharacterized protein n=1 Tax=Vespula maculifrons TaxID=7453 RepID=A0ABD2D143_VESMC
MLVSISVLLVINLRSAVEFGTSLVIHGKSISLPVCTYHCDIISTFRLRKSVTFLTILAFVIV